MPRGEELEGLAVLLQTFELTGEPYGAIGPLAPVEAADAHGVARRNEVTGAPVNNDACKDAVQPVPELIAVAQLGVHVAHDSRIAGGTQVRVVQHILPDLLLVIDLAVQRPCDVSLRSFYGERLPSSLSSIHNVQALEGQKLRSILAFPHGGGIWPSVPLLFGRPHHLYSVSFSITLHPQGCKDAAHGANSQTHSPPVTTLLGENKGVGDSYPLCEHSTPQIVEAILSNLCAGAGVG
mmetsp:Transcript_11273/g.33871  ORF Transcript_11273/g.33871 Transcript_11273/m.33871 type:complete len:237 (+) Transcript_11273:1768-2478(+)